MPDLTISIPSVPDSVLLPNSRAHYYRRNGAYQEQRAIAALATSQALCGAPVFATAYELDMTVSWPRGRRKPDLDNCIASLKSTIDGIADALGIDDRHLYALRVSQRMSNNGGGIEVRVTLLAPDETQQAANYGRASPSRKRTKTAT